MEVGVVAPAASCRRGPAAAACGSAARPSARRRCRSNRPGPRERASPPTGSRPARRSRRPRAARATGFSRRIATRFCVVSMPSTWSTRYASSPSSASSAFSARALSRSSPNGFSTATRLPGGRPASPSDSIVVAKTRGRQREIGRHRLRHPVERRREGRGIVEVDASVGEHAGGEAVAGQASHALVVELAARGADDAEALR